MSDFADRWYEAKAAEAAVEDDLFEALEAVGLKSGYTDFTSDAYDNSIELYGCEPDLRLTPEQLDAVWKMGFSICWLNHTDKWETQYSRDKTSPYRTERPEVRGPFTRAEFRLRDQLTAAQSDTTKLRDLAQRLARQLKTARKLTVKYGWPAAVEKIDAVLTEARAEGLLP